MQRLFSTFPGSWPGLGLLILRFTVGLSPYAVLTTPFALDGAVFAPLVLAVAAVLSACVLLGAATPLVSPALAVMVILASRQDAWAIWLALVGGSTSLMLVGPGAWSVDALLYGRKRIHMD